MHGCTWCRREGERTGLCGSCKAINHSPNCGMSRTTRHQLLVNLSALHRASDDASYYDARIGELFGHLRNVRRARFVGPCGVETPVAEGALCPLCGNVRGGMLQCGSCGSFPFKEYFVISAYRFSSMCLALASFQESGYNQSFHPRLGSMIEGLNTAYPVDLGREAQPADEIRIQSAPPAGPRHSG